jgi:hypothetical protein
MLTDLSNIYPLMAHLVVVGLINSTKRLKPKKKKTKREQLLAT